MKKFVIERNLPGAGNMTAQELQGISQTSCSVLKNMHADVQWQQSYVTGDKIYCVYLATSEAKVLEHAKLGGFPANAINEVLTIIDPCTAG
jgi:hypothetical protein